jgi:hypothetical protein
MRLAALNGRLDGKAHIGGQRHGRRKRRQVKQLILIHNAALHTWDM